MFPKLARTLASQVYAGMPVLDRWRHLAACGPGSGVDPDLFTLPGNKAREEAMRVCRECPVVASCLAEALSMPWNPIGVWGGTSGWQRKHLRNTSGAAEVCQECGGKIRSSEAVYCSSCRHLLQRERSVHSGVLGEGAWVASRCLPAFA